MPTGPDWLHEVKYDGYRIMVIREDDRVRPIPTGGYDWAPSFPIVEAARKLRQSHFIIDGEAVVLGPDGVSDFAALHKHSEQAQLYAFDMLARVPHGPLSSKAQVTWLERFASNRVCRMFNPR